MWHRKRSSTRGLTSDALVISDSRRQVRVLAAILALVLIALGATLLAAFLDESPTRGPVPLLDQPTNAGNAQATPDEAMFAALEAQNEVLRVRAQSLQDALDGATLDLEVERATRAELELQLKGLREHLAQTQEELAFLKNAGNGATKP
ncbi:MAG TPA: hypothetical protein PLR02_00355 [Rhodocyclaceae bacterium]|nr:hypothetical protein [Rhodocyclaceae bacterium]